MSQNRIALVTAVVARDLDEDLVPLETALRACAAQVTIAAWDDAAIHWARFDVALLRSTWDYTQRLPEFLDWIGRTETQTRLLNPLEVVRWNTDKHYLCDLEKAGVAIVPSAFIEPGENATARLNEFLQTHGSISPHPPSAPSPAGGGREEFEVPAPARAGGGREGDKFVQVRGSASLHPPSTPSCAGEGREAFEFSAPDRQAGEGRRSKFWRVLAQTTAGKRLNSWSNQPLAPVRAMLSATAVRNALRR